MRVLFIARHFTYFRNYESVIQALAARGHAIHLAAERGEELGGREMVERLAAAHPGISTGWIPDRGDGWAIFATKLRLTIDYLRYLDPAYATTPKLRARARERVPPLGLWVIALCMARTRVGRRLAGAVLRAVERAIPPSRRIDAYLRDQRPDVVLFTPLIGVVASPQLDYLQSAKHLQLPTALAVWSWDHLSSKAIVRNVPDRVFVWNETQRDEAVNLHRVAAERVVVTGAQCFDRWFDRRPSTDRAAFCRRVGLADDRPFLLYVCSSLFRGSPSEALFVERWIRALRASGLSPLSSMPILVRPHPARMKEWQAVDIRAERDVALWGRNPVDAEAQADYFDSLHYSDAIVGLNTSAFLEGAIAGRPVFAPLLPEYHENQEGTIHFHYLLTVAGGLLHTARSLGEHFEQLNQMLGQGERESARSRRFVETFIRPRGLSVAATPLFVDAVEQLVNVGPGRASRAPRSEAGLAIARLLLTPIAWLLTRDMARPLMTSARERALEAGHRRRRESRTRVRQEKHEREVLQQRTKEARAAARLRYKAKRASEWRRAKMTKKWKRRLKQRIGLGQ